jgi:hypothetical protein
MGDVVPWNGLRRGALGQRRARNRSCWGVDAVSQIKTDADRARLKLDRDEMMGRRVAFDIESVKPKPRVRSPL